MGLGVARGSGAVRKWFYKKMPQINIVFYCKVFNYRVQVNSMQTGQAQSTTSNTSEMFF